MTTPQLVARYSIGHCSTFIYYVLPTFDIWLIFVLRADVRKGVDMFIKLGVPVLGMVQNMSSFTCGNCGHINQLFGHDETLKMAESLNIDMLGDVPLDPQIAHSCDSGVPLVISHPNSQAAKVYGEIAEKICSQIFVSDC